MKNRINQIKKYLEANELPGLLLTEPNNIRYISGFSGHAATVLITQQSQYFITDYRYDEQARQEVSDFEVICRDRVKHTLADVIRRLLDQEAIEELGFEGEHVSIVQWKQWHRALKLRAMVPTSRVVEDLRYVKSADEIKCIQTAASMADVALKRVLNEVREGITENELAIELEYQMRVEGSEEPAFPTILLFGERSALPHGVPGNRRLKKGDLMLFDFGAVVQGYRSDMTRTYVFGQPSDEQKEVHATVSAAQQAALDAIEVGVTGEFLYQQAAQVIQSSAYAQYMGEGLGHGVGLDLHEFPFMGEGCQLKVEKGCVVTIEPGIYIPNWGGVRVEDDVVLGDTGLQVLNNSPRELLVL